MTGLREWFAGGGWTMVALAALALALWVLILERYVATGRRLRDLRLGRAIEPPTGDANLTGLRRMGLIRACIVIAPLLGLLGTVTGMIETFDSILRGGYIAEMSDGIRKALLTTQYGLAIAAPGLLAESVLLRRQDKLARLARAERLRRKGESPCAGAC
jgi:biopolymer transport protein ExbB/TolQ